MLPLPSQLHHCGSVQNRPKLTWACRLPRQLAPWCCLARSRWTWISHQPAKSYHSFLGLLINSRSLCDWLLCFVSQESAPLSYPFLFGLAICMLGHRKILMFMLQRTCRCLTAANRFSIFAADWRYQSYIYILHLHPRSVVGKSCTKWNCFSFDRPCLAM